MLGGPGHGYENSRHLLAGRARRMDCLTALTLRLHGDATACEWALGSLP